VTERTREAACDPAGGRPVACVEGRLAAADLGARELDLESGFAEERLGVGDGVGEDEVAETGREKLDTLSDT